MKQIGPKVTFDGKSVWKMNKMLKIVKKQIQALRIAYFFIKSKGIEVLVHFIDACNWKKNRTRHQRHPLLSHAQYNVSRYSFSSFCWKFDFLSICKFCSIFLSHQIRISRHVEQSIQFARINAVRNLLPKYSKYLCVSNKLSIITDNWFPSSLIVFT